jgi:hypothetical protein
MGNVMATAALVLGIVLMFLGVGLVIAAVFREVGHGDTHGWHAPAFVAAGFALIFLGRWLIQ